MATLGETGLLEQAHTSAGRVPTAAAFRYYVEQITQVEAAIGAGWRSRRAEQCKAHALNRTAERSTPRAD
jgi:heat-inducible transcriptional repressor